jgi:uncharacterized membrane protein
MTGRLLGVVAPVAAVSIGLLAGVYVAFTVAVMPALHRLPAALSAEVMRWINRCIVNPVFGTLFVVAAVSALGTLVLGLLDGRPVLAIGGALGFAGGHLLTVVRNIPLNTALDRADDPARGWQEFERPWNRAHTARSVLTVAGAILLVV